MLGSCAELYTDEYLPNNNTLQVIFSNASECWAGHGKLSINWTIPLIAGISSPSAVNQINSGLYKVSWKNKYYNTGFVNVSDPQLVPFSSSSIQFSEPFSGENSSMNVRILTSSTLLKNDVILLKLSKMTFPTLIGAHNLISDNIGRSWSVSHNVLTYTLSLVVPKNLHPAALQFNFDTVTLPTSGIPSFNSPNYTISLSRQSQTLTPQNIQYVQPVGSILYSDIRAIVQKRREFGGLNDSFHGYKDGSRNVRFEIVLVGTSFLNAGDVISLKASQFSFNYDAELTIEGSDFIARADSAKKTIVVTSMKNHHSSTFSFNILPSLAIGVSLTKCDQTLKQCPIFISVESNVCPARNHITYARSYYLFPYSSIQLRTVRGIPTQYPTSAPTGKPSGQPSKQPSSQPSNQPTRQPTSRPTTPTGQPSARPSRQPTHQPTRQPSSQPSSRPTQKPTSYPTNSYQSFLSLSVSQVILYILVNRYYYYINLILCYF